MASRTDAEATTEQPRVPLSRRRVLRAAVDVADRGGLDALTMRRLAQELGVEAMSLYHHVANKDAILDGVIDVVAGEILEAVDRVDAPAPEDDWQTAMRSRILAAREVLLRHPWAPRLLETRTTMSPMIVGYFDGVLGILRAGGFSYDLAHHALHVLGSRALGFTQELFEPDDPDAADANADAMLEQMGDSFRTSSGCWPRSRTTIRTPRATRPRSWRCDRGRVRDRAALRPGADWVRNIMAAGITTIEHEGRTVRVTGPELVPADDASPPAVRSQGATDAPRVRRRRLPPVAACRDDAGEEPRCGRTTLTGPQLRRACQTLRSPVTPGRSRRAPSEDPQTAHPPVAASFDRRRSIIQALTG